jgi:outer membrane protein assembly factor BamE (lipoprotein component of BamABCDE complex)
MVTRIALIVVLALLVGAGCAPKIGRDFNASYLSSIERGVTTKSQVRQNLGEPSSVTTSSLAGETWSYQYMEGAGLAQTYGNFFRNEYTNMGSHKMLVVTFDGDRVKDYTYSETK